MSVATEETAPTPVENPDDGSDSLTHLTCACNMDVALCGTNVADAPVVEKAPDTEVCVVCLHLDYGPCPRCGDW